MQKEKYLNLLYFTILILVTPFGGFACSMYKITYAGKTMVGCNEDAWRTTSTIWFEKARNKSEYGAGFTGSRKVSGNRIAPQSGMNEAGLTFSRLASYFPKQPMKINKKIITDEATYLSDILHQCATISEVKNYIEMYDYSYFIDDVFIYIDSTGSYLVVEPYNLIEGIDPSYALSNFCPSITSIEKARGLERYRNGVDFLTAYKPDTALSFCTALSDTMHVCRKRNGDGTLLTSIWDTQKMMVHLYFYHNYDHAVSFNLTKELAKGDHRLRVANFFPANPEFERLVNYKTPFNRPILRVLLAMTGGLLMLISLVWIIIYFINRKKKEVNKLLIFKAGVNMLLTFYLFILATNINIYYFDVPYHHFQSRLISASSYFPVLLLLSIFPAILWTAQYFRMNQKKSWISSLLVFNILMYLVAIGGFHYWGLFDIVH